MNEAKCIDVSNEPWVDETIREFEAARRERHLDEVVREVEEVLEAYGKMKNILDEWRKRTP